MKKWKIRLMAKMVFLTGLLFLSVLALFFGNALTVWSFGILTGIYLGSISALGSIDTLKGEYRD